jgi:hypothetical protein
VSTEWIVRDLCTPTNDEEGRVMGILKRKDERTETVTVRVPVSVKAELDQLREQTGEAGFDLNATLSDAVSRVTRQIRDELKQVTHPVGAANPRSRVNGLVNSHTESVMTNGKSQG